MDSISSSSTKNNLLILKSRYGNLAVATAVPLLVIFGGSAYLAFTYFNCDDCPWRKKKATVRERSLTLASLQGGEFALQRLVDYEEALANFPYAFRAVECLLNVLLEREYIDLSMIKRVIANFEMSGNEAKAVQILQTHRLKARDNQNFYKAYEIEMLLVEMYIYKGDFEKAYFQLECFTEEHCLDSRRPFFKALILVALERHRYTELAKQNWENFNELREEPIEGNETYKVATSFNEFEKIVKRLKNDIHKSNEMKKIPID
ncbi:uncharacterized protein LOC133800755 isoform X1 [Humulus lupulus]|uniref:uncharacterized protein LOC133800755 isoform X1 n=1 Tax=Humulus lupulus TaxID=3486 RepID=UPI002B411081|nr:uncharacterized protein LOC133800755 isoform X1 [Humulus lupulus]